MLQKLLKAFILLPLIAFGVFAQAEAEDDPTPRDQKAICAEVVTSISSHPRFAGRSVRESRAVLGADQDFNVDSRLLARLQWSQAVARERQQEEREKAFFARIEEMNAVPFYLIAEVGRHHARLKQYENLLLSAAELSAPLARRLSLESLYDLIPTDLRIKAMLKAIKAYPRYARTVGDTPEEIQQGIDAFVSRAGKIFLYPYSTREMSLLIAQVGSIEIRLRMLGLAVGHASNQRQNRDFVLLYTEAWAEAASAGEMESEELGDHLVNVLISATRNESRFAQTTEDDIPGMLVEILRRLASPSPLLRWRTGGFDAVRVFATLAPILKVCPHDEHLVAALRNLVARAPRGSALGVRASRLIMQMGI